MTWLLHRLQKLLGVRSGKVSQQANRKNNGAIAPHPISEATRVSLRPPDDEPLDTDRRLDATSEVLPGDTPVSPSFPPEVSDLITSTTPLVKPYAAPPDLDQLPKIHDLLPAVEPAESDLQSSSLANAEPVDVEPVDAEPPVDVEPVDASALPEPETVEPTAVAVDKQAVLFSFDIIEHKTNRAEQALPASSEEPESHSLEATSEVVTAFEIAEEVPTEAVSLSAELSDELSDESAAVADLEPLPYPWSITVPQKSSPSTTVAPEPISTPPSEAVPAVVSPSDQKPVKKGVVKLLFTLKEGNFHGYIAPDDGTKDILFHQKYINSEIFDSLERGAEVAAAVKYIEGKVYATRVDLL
ncbi:MAG: cold shock domain-containing protein [Phormidesmis sp.]